MTATDDTNAEFRPADVRNGLFYLGTLLGSGLPPADALQELALIDPDRAQFWKAASRTAAEGFPLSHCLKPILTPAHYAAIHAAEETGATEEVLRLIENTYVTEENVGDALKTLRQPTIMAGVGIGIFVFFSVYVIPTLSKSFPSAANDPIIKLTIWLNDMYHQYDTVILGGLVALLVGAAVWIREPANKQTLHALAAELPYIGNALTNLRYGVWASYISIATKAGIGSVDALRLTRPTLPDYLHGSITAVMEDAVQYGLARASDPSGRPIDDPRHKFPRLIITAFRIAERTGATDKAFGDAARALIQIAIRQVKLFSATAYHIITPLAGGLIASAILPYLVQVGNAMEHLH